MALCLLGYCTAICSVHSQAPALDGALQADANGERGGVGLLRTRGRTLQKGVFLPSKHFLCPPEPFQEALPLKNPLRTLLRSVLLHDPLGVHPTEGIKSVKGSHDGNLDQCSRFRPKLCKHVTLSKTECQGHPCRRIRYVVRFGVRFLRVCDRLFLVRYSHRNPLQTSGC